MAKRKVKSKLKSRRNPVKARLTKTVRAGGKVSKVSRTVGPYLTKAELEALKKSVLKSMGKARAAKPGSSKRKRAIEHAKYLNRFRKRAQGKADASRKMIEALIKEGFHVEKGSKASWSEAKKALGLGKRKKKKAAKKSSVTSKKGSESIMAKKKSSRKAKKSTAPKRRRRKSRKSRKVSAEVVRKAVGFYRRAKKTRKGKKVGFKVGKRRRIFKRTNPLNLKALNVQAVFGHSGEEALSLLAGGAIYSSVNTFVRTNPVTAKAVSAINKGLGVLGPTVTQVVGPVVPNLLIGIALNQVASRVKLPKQVQDVAKGLISASVVLLGANAVEVLMGKGPGTQGMLPSLNGVDFTPDMGALPQGLSGEYSQLGSQADFGSPDFGAQADFGNYPSLNEQALSGVDFTPYSMDGVDFTPDMGADADFGGAEQQLG